MYSNVIKHFGYLRNLEDYSLQLRFSTFLKCLRILSQCKTRLRLLYLLIKSVKLISPFFYNVICDLYHQACERRDNEVGAQFYI